MGNGRSRPKQEKVESDASGSNDKAGFTSPVHDQPPAKEESSQHTAPASHKVDLTSPGQPPAKEESQLSLHITEHSAPVISASQKEDNHALWYASYYGRDDLVLLFLEQKAVVDLPTNDIFGETALIAASGQGHIKCTTVLLKHRADINYLRKLQGDTPLIRACANGHLRMAVLLIDNRAVVDYANTQGCTALTLACRNGHANIVDLLLYKGANINKGALLPVYGASVGGHLAIVKLLVSRGATIDQPCDEAPCATPLLVACLNNHPQVASYLISKGARVNYKNTKGSTSLHVASLNGHRAVAQLLIESQAKLDIKNNNIETPIDVARRCGHSEILNLLERAGHTSSAGNEESSSNVQAEGRKLDMMMPISKENYVCIAQSSNCLVYLSKDINQKFSIETVTDTDIHSKIASNEIEVTPIVRITPDNTTISLNKPAIIELLKNVELSEKEAKNETIPICAETETSEWKELGSECKCKVHKDRISFEVTHFSLYTVISRKPFPSSTKVVKPSADIPAPTEVTISDLPGFKVQIPPCSVNADRDVKITATMLYDCPAVCSEQDRSCLASSCIGLEPHGITFSKNVSISIPIPNYDEVIENNPNAQLEVWHSDIAANKQWNLVDHCLCKDEDGRYIAVVETNHFSTFMAKFKNLVSRLKNLFNNSFIIKARCQVFMSQERVIKSQLMFGIAVLFSPHKNEPDSIPQNYKHVHVLADSDRLDLQVSKHDKIQFSVEFNKPLLPCEPITGLFDINGRQQNAFTIELDGNVVLSGGLPMGKLSIGVKGGLKQTILLFKPSEPSSTSFNLKTTYQFEESIVELEDSAKRLGQDVIQYKESPGSIVEAVNKVVSMWKKMAQLIRKECILKEEVFKDDIVDVAKNINKESQEVTRIATVAAGACTDSGLREAVCGVVERTRTISHQLRILAQGETSRQRDEASDLEACKLLATNAKNLRLVISETLHHTHSACIRIDEATRKNLGLSKIENVSSILNQGEDSETLSQTNQLTDAESSGSDKLNITDLHRVQTSTWGARSQWYNVGLGLGISPDTLDAIKRDNRDICADCYGAMLKQWLKEEPALSSLAEALRSPSVNMGHLAQELMSMGQ